MLEEQVTDGESEEQLPAIQRQRQRQRNLPARFNEFEMASDADISEEGELIHYALMADSEPLDLNEALKQSKWRLAMVDELKAIERNNTWELVTLPQNKVPIGVKWVYKLKLNPDGSIAKHKARLVAKGFLQRHGLDYT